MRWSSISGLCPVALIFFAATNTELSRGEDGGVLAGKIGLMGDSLMVATNADQMCGSGKELPTCLKAKLGQHDVLWSHGGGDHPWSIAHRLGYRSEQVVNAARDGERWKDALLQAERITTDPEVDTVLIHLGANDVCAPFGHDYAGDLAAIERHVDDTLSHLITHLGPGAEIYWSGLLDIVGFRDVMVNRRHTYMFHSCQGLWDLDSDEITEEAAQSICKDQGFNEVTCDALADWARIRDRIMDDFFDHYLDKYGVDEGPCGRILDSANSLASRDEARQFNRDLNNLFARKAQEYDGRNGIEIIFTNALYDVHVEPNDVSRLDCYHPSRAGQMKLAQEIWRGLLAARQNNVVAKVDSFGHDQGFSEGKPVTAEETYTYWYDEFNDADQCSEEFGASWASCWEDYGDPGFDIRVDGQGWLRVQKDTNRNRRRYVVRHVGDLSGKVAAWMSFNHKRENLDDGGDRVYFKVFKDGVWYLLDVFKGSGNDVGEHCGQYYDLTPYISSDVRIRFETENQRSMKSGDRVRFDNISVFAWGVAGDEF